VVAQIELGGSLHSLLRLALLNMTAFDSETRHVEALERIVGIRIVLAPVSQVTVFC
jgi:hypothetical protein